MAARGSKSSTGSAPAPEPAAPPLDRASLDLKALAEAVLARTFRPRVGEVRRLAEAVLKKKKGKSKKPDGKKRKPSKIPARKSRK